MNELDRWFVAILKRIIALKERGLTPEADDLVRTVLCRLPVAHAKGEYVRRKGLSVDSAEARDGRDYMDACRDLLDKAEYEMGGRR